MINNNVQFTAKNPVSIGKKGVEIAENAIESYAASRGNIDNRFFKEVAKPVVDHHITLAEISAAKARRPIRVNVADLPSVDNKMVQRAESYGVSHGNIENEMPKGGIDYLA